MKIVTKPEAFPKWSMDASLDFETEIDGFANASEVPVRIEVDRRLFYVDRFEVYAVTVTIAGIAMPWRELTPAIQKQVETEIEKQDDANAEDAYMRDQENLRK